MLKLIKSLLLLVAALTSSVLAGDDDIFCMGVPDKTFVRDPSACYRFFLCVDERAHLEYCPEGQYFDYWLQGCDDIERVYCADGGGTVLPTPITTSSSDVESSMCDGVVNYRYLPSTEACNRYYQCMNGQAFPFLCPAGQFFDEARQTCDLEDNVVCDPTTDTTPDSTTVTTTGPTAPTPGPTVTPPADICVGVPNFQYVRYPNSCYLFVQCINDVAYSFACELGLWFNEVTSECDDPANVECDPFIPTPPATTTTPTPPIGACDDVADGQFVRSTVTCHSFFRCENDTVAETYNCPIGEWFDAVRQECDIIDNVDCETGNTTTTTTTTPYPTPPSTEDICKGVEDFVYVPSPTSCSLFYMCLGEIPYLIACPPDQWFDFELQGCDLQENLACNISTTAGPTSTTAMVAQSNDENERCIGVEDYTYIPSFDSCNDYYMCRNDTAYLQSCPPGTYFDMERQTCDLPQNVPCDITTTQSTVQTDTPPTPPSPAPTTTTVAPPVDICSGVLNRFYVRNPYSCHTFFACEDDEIDAVFYCPIGEWFDQERQRCDLIDNVDCEAAVPTTPSPGGDICVDVADGQFVRSPDACHIFYECTGGSADEMMCPIGEWFDEEQQECDIIDNVDCELGNGTTTTTVTPTLTPPSTEDLCKDLGDLVYLPSPASCSLFYMCLDEVPYLVSCLPGYWFDFALQGCHPEEDVECNISTTAGPSSTTATRDENDRCIGVEDYSYIPSFESCNDFYMCRNDTAYLQSCPPGTYFDMERQTCDLPQNVPCDITTTQSTVQTDTPPTPPSPAPTTTTVAPPWDICLGVLNRFYVRNPYSCYTFFACEDDEIDAVFYCPIGEWFDQERQQCDLIDNVDCEAAVPTTPSPGGDICVDIADGEFVRSPDACHIFYECTGGNADEMMCPIGEWFDVDRQECDTIDNVDCELGGATTAPTTTTVTPTPEICQGIADGQYVRSPNACNLFYVCIGGVGDLRSCPIGEWFDEERQACDVIENVDCDLDIVSSTTPAPASDACASLPDGEFVRNPDSCHVFYECHDGAVGAEQWCPIGKWFDLERQECGEIDNVDCELS